MIPGLPLDVHFNVMDHLSIVSCISLLQTFAELYYASEFWLYIGQRPDNKQRLAQPPSLDITMMDVESLRRIVLRSASIHRNLTSPSPTAKSVQILGYPENEYMIRSIHGTEFVLTFSINYYESLEAMALVISLYDWRHRTRLQQVTYPIQFRSYIADYRDMFERSLFHPSTDSPCTNLISFVINSPKSDTCLVVLHVDYRQEAPAVIEELSRMPLGATSVDLHNVWIDTNHSLISVLIKDDGRRGILHKTVPISTLSKLEGLKLTLYLWSDVPLSDTLNLRVAKLCRKRIVLVFQKFKGGFRSMSKPGSTWLYTSIEIIPYGQAGFEDTLILHPIPALDNHQKAIDWRAMIALPESDDTWIMTVPSSVKDATFKSSGSLEWVPYDLNGNERARLPTKPLTESSEVIQLPFPHRPRHDTRILTEESRDLFIRTWKSEPSRRLPTLTVFAKDRLDSPSNTYTACYLPIPAEIEIEEEKVEIEKMASNGETVINFWQLPSALHEVSYAFDFRLGVLTLLSVSGRLYKVQF